MKSLMLIIPSILVLACGSVGSEEETSFEEPMVTTETEIEVALEEESNNNMLYLLQNGSAGLFELGITQNKVEELALSYGNVTIEEIDLMTEGMSAPAIELTFTTGETILLEIAEDDRTVYRIVVRSDLFTTEEGIGTGSSYNELESSYEFDGVAWGDGGNPLVIVEEAGFSFMIEPGDWWQMGDVEGEIPGDAIITGIFLW